MLSQLMLLLGQNLGRDTGYPDRVLEFTQYLQANAACLEIGRDCFSVLTHFRVCINHHTIRHCVV